VTDTYDFGHAVFTIEGENRQFVDTLRSSEVAVDKSVGKMTGQMSGMTKQTIGASQAFSLLGPSVSAVGGKFSSVLGPLVGVGAAIAGIGAALLTLPVMLAAAVAGVAYFGYQWAKFGDELERVDAILSAKQERWKQIQRDNETAIKKIRQDMAVMRGAPLSSFEGTSSVKAVLIEREQLVLEIAREKSAEAIETATVGRMNALYREVSILEGVTDEYDYILDKQEQSLALELKHLRIAKEYAGWKKQVAQEEKARVSSGQVQTLAEAQTFLLERIASATAQRETSRLLEVAARFMTAVLGPGAANALSPFIPATTAAATAPDAPATHRFGLAAFGSFHGGGRPAPTQYGTASGDTTKQKLDALIQAALYGKGIKVQLPGMP